MQPLSSTYHAFKVRRVSDFYFSIAFWGVVSQLLVCSVLITFWWPMESRGFSKSTNNLPKSVQFGVLCSKGFQGGPKDAFWLLLDAFWRHFGATLEVCLLHFGCTSWDALFSLLELLTRYFSTHLKPSSTRYKLYMKGSFCHWHYMLRRDYMLEDSL